jgi:hypothetical protein
MAEKRWPVVIGDKDTPTLFVNKELHGIDIRSGQIVENTTALLSIERLGGGLVVVSQAEAQKLAEVLQLAIADLEKA